MEDKYKKKCDKLVVKTVEEIKKDKFYNRIKHRGTEKEKKILQQHFDVRKNIKIKKEIKNIMDENTVGVVNHENSPDKVIIGKSETKKKNTKNAQDKEQLIIDEFNKNIKYRKQLCNEIGITNYENAKASKPSGSRQTEEWIQKKEGTKERNSKPKTDICIQSNENTIRISLKSGKGRLTSADCYETNAIFLSVLETSKYNSNIDLKNKVNQIIYLMKDIGKKKKIDGKSTKKKIEQQAAHGIDTEDTQWLNKFNKNQMEIIKIWNDLRKKYPEYIKDILYECITGRHKFGDTIGCADWCLVTNEDKDDIEIKESFNLFERSEELDNYCENTVPNSDTSIFALKSSSGKMWMRFL